MRRFFRLSLLSAAISSAILALTVGAPLAHATCLFTCKTELHFEDCTLPPMDTWPLGTPLTFTAACETCCSAPGGPTTCDPSPVDLTMFSVRDVNFNAIAGSFSPKNVKCESTDLFAFDGQLGLGQNQIALDNLILVQFEVVDTGMGSGGSGGTGGMGSSSSSGSGGAGGIPAKGDEGSQSNSGCSIGQGSSGNAADGLAMAALALAGIAARRRRS